MSASLLKTFLCPITQQIMKDPVVGSDGNTYERVAIEEWLRKNPISPISRESMTISSLRTNRSLRDSIETTLKNTPQTELTKLQTPSNSDTVCGNHDVSITYHINSENNLLLSIQSPDIEKRPPCDIVLVVDISGSMQTEATMKSSDGSQQEHGLSILDIVKHAIKTIIKSVSDNDRISLVVFDTYSEVIFGLSEMNPIAKTQSIKSLEDLHPKSTTNLWGGILSGLEILSNRKDTTRNASLMVFTDGAPNIQPPRGELYMLKKFKDNHIIDPTIYTFGFGYSLDSQLLFELAKEGNGMYNFIPDSSMVGTIFVNAISYVLSTMGTNVKLNLRTKNNTKIKQILGESITPNTDNVQLNIGNIMFGQSNDIIVVLDNITPDTDYLEMELSYQTNGRIFHKNLTLNQFNCSAQIQKHVQRLRMVELIYNYIDKLSKNYCNHQDHITPDLIQFTDSITDPCLLQDLNGQITIALTNREYFNKWGKHYLPSLSRAHQLQICNNFKDPGVQQYGGVLFNRIRDEADTVFNDIPPPKPSIKKSYSYGYSSSRSNSTVTSMSQYNCSSDPCYHQDCLITMADNTQKQVKDLSKNDKILTPKGVASIICLLKTICQDGISNLVTFDNGLIITPWHPIMTADGDWEFPVNLKTPVKTPCEAVYSLVLDVHHMAYINGVTTITLGHSYSDDVIKHPYFGSAKVIEDLMRMPGWNSGLITVCSGCMSATNGVIDKLVYNGNANIPQ